MTVFVTYDTASGRPIQVNSCSDDLFSELPDPDAGQGRIVIDTHPDDAIAYLQAHYIVADVLTTRATITPTISASSFTADGTTTVTIGALPDPCSVTITGVLTAGPTDVTGGSIDISSDVPGDLTVSVSADPVWLSWSTILHAV